MKLRINDIFPYWLFNDLYWEKHVRQYLFKQSKLVYWVGGLIDRWPVEAHGKPAMYFNKYTDMNT